MNDMYILGCLFAINKLVENGSSYFATKIDDDWHTVSWDKIIDWLESNLNNE